jgi:TonB family protein
MTETWKQWEGRTVDGRFLLKSYLGGSDHSAVFLTESGASGRGKAAIKLIAAEGAGAEQQLLRWKAARDLNHPNLIRIFEAGLCELDGTKLLYVGQEYAEENLSQILPERALTAEETRGMLPPLLRALQYVHDKRYVHGHIKPSNILAVADQVKLSSDTLGEMGEKSRGARSVTAYDPPEAATGATSTAADIWQLGMTLAEVLTQRLPVWNRAQSAAPEISETIPEPFREIIWNCLQVDPGKRWTVAQVSYTCGAEPLALSPPSARHETPIAEPSVSSEKKSSAKWPYLAAMVAAAVIAVFLIARSKPSEQPGEGPSIQSQPAAAGVNAPSASSSNPAEPKPNLPAAEEDRISKKVARTRTTDPTAPAASERTSGNADQSGILQRVMPQVSPSARRTITGTIKVRVKVDVDAAGNVQNAALDSEPQSKYFSRIALEAARDWKFSPASADGSGAREWKLQFAFSRAKTETSAVRARQ